MSPYYDKKRELLSHELFSTFYELQISAVKRSHATFTLVFLQIPEHRMEQWDELLQHIIRETDIAFRFPTPHPYIVLLPNVREHAAIVFLKRTLDEWQAIGYPVTDIYVSIVNVSSTKAPIREVVQVGKQALQQIEETTDLRNAIDASFSIREAFTIKVSIIDEDPVVTRVLSNLLRSAAIDKIKIDLRVFYDGLAFLESDWYQSSHSHVVILNDVLPRKTGLEVLQQLRAMPGERRFHIFMMTRSPSEDDMIYAYEQGVDEQIIKPFNPKLFQAQIKKLLGRLYI